MHNKDFESLKISLKLNQSLNQKLVRELKPFTFALRTQITHIKKLQYSLIYVSASIAMLWTMR